MSFNRLSIDCPTGTHVHDRISIRCDGSRFTTRNVETTRYVDVSVSCVLIVKTVRINSCLAKLLFQCLHQHILRFKLIAETTLQLRMAQGRPIGYTLSVATRSKLRTLLLNMFKEMPFRSNDRNDRCECSAVA